MKKVYDVFIFMTIGAGFFFLVWLAITFHFVFIPFAFFSFLMFGAGVIINTIFEKFGIDLTKYFR